MSSLSTSYLGRLYLNLAQRPSLDLAWLLTLLLAEYALGWLILQRVAYTEIDWVAYMQEVEAVVLRGELNYTKIRGDTGPLVYPAGFVYLFALLRWLTERGLNIPLAQHVFLGFYVATQGTVGVVVLTCLQAERRRFGGRLSQHHDDWRAHRVWGWRLLLGLLCLSKRLHSIFLLRLFNDGPTMLLCYMSIWLFMKQKWDWGCLVFSLAVSIKMNVLLFAPGLLLLLLQQVPDWYTVVVRRLFLGCALPQLVLGAPFLATYPLAYLRKAFELDRVFFYEWTVNFRFLPEDLFVSKSWSLLLLSLHITSLVVLAWKWVRHARQSTPNQKLLFLFASPTTATTSATTTRSSDLQLAPDYIAYTMMVSNFVGIAFARTLHYQFYCWYFHSIPIMLWYASGARPQSSSKVLGQLVLVVAIMATLEYAFLTFPSTSQSSALLQVAHLVTLGCIVTSPLPRMVEEPPRTTARVDAEKKSR